MMKEYLAKFLPRYIDQSLQKPTQLNYTFPGPLGIKFFDTHFLWTDIKYSPIDLKFNEVKFDIIPAEDGKSGLLHVDFPALKHFTINASQTVKHWFLPSTSVVQLDIQDFDFDFTAGLKLDRHGYLDPEIKDVNIKFGKTDFHHEIWILEAIFHQIIYFSIIACENSARLFGDVMFSGMLGPAMDHFLNHYLQVLPIKSIIKGQNAVDLFALDFRNTFDPTFENSGLLFKFVGEFFYKEQGCQYFGPMLFEPISVPSSYIGLSDASATCLFEKLGQSHLSNFKLNHRSRNLLFNLKGEFTTTTLKTYIPLFSKKLGQDWPLSVSLSYKEPRIKFQHGQTNVEVKMILCMQFKYDHLDDLYRTYNMPDQELLYDELPFEVSFDIINQSDKTQISLKRWQLGKQPYGAKQYPHRNTLNMTKEDYRDFIASLWQTLEYQKKFLNSGALNDIPYPYSVPEFDTHFIFKTGVMYFVAVQTEMDYK